MTKELYGMKQEEQDVANKHGQPAKVSAREISTAWLIDYIID